jgi:hypothetical protein
VERSFPLAVILARGSDIKRLMEGQADLPARGRKIDPPAYTFAATLIT